MPFLLIGLVLGWRREPGVLLVYVFIVVQAGLMVLLVTGYVRYRIHNMPLCLVLASLGVVWLYGRAREGIILWAQGRGKRTKKRRQKKR